MYSRHAELRARHAYGKKSGNGGPVDRGAAIEHGGGRCYTKAGKRERRLMLDEDLRALRLRLQLRGQAAAETRRHGRTGDTTPHHLNVPKP
jgi:hypothetical protein